MPQNILLVEDYDDSRQMLKFFLENIGYRVAEADDGTSAVQFVNDNSPDLILMDVAMPDLDGLEATRRIKQKAPHIPIICITAYPKAFAEHAFEAGCDEIIPKPVDLNQLREILGRYLRKG